MSAPLDGRPHNEGSRVDRIPFERLDHQADQKPYWQADRDRDTHSFAGIAENLVACWRTRPATSPMPVPRMALATARLRALCWTPRTSSPTSGATGVQPLAARTHPLGWRSTDPATGFGHGQTNQQRWSSAEISCHPTMISNPMSTTSSPSPTPTEVGSVVSPSGVVTVTVGRPLQALLQSSEHPCHGAFSYLTKSKTPTQQGSQRPYPPRPHRVPQS